MKIVFISNSYNHHQKPFCDAMYGIVGEDYCFIETRPIRKERVEMGWGQEVKPCYVKQNYISEDAKRLCQELIDDADVVIHASGSAPNELVRDRINKKKLVFIYSERIYKTGCPYHKLLWHTLLNYSKGYMCKNTFLLCSSAYSVTDFTKTISFIGKTYKWGYFPRLKVYELDDLFAEKRKKEKVSILWVGRFLKWKHPEVPILIAERLKRNGYNFDLNIIGSGELETSIRHMVTAKDLEDHVHFLGTMLPEQVREHMEASDIYLFTSDFNEGWGAVLNESMNSGCAVVASHAIGAVPFLISDTENGFIYRNGSVDSAYDRVVRLIEQPEVREKMGKEAYRTIAELWNAEVAVERFLQLVDVLLSGKTVDLFMDGPCSRAKLITNGWYKNGKNRKSASSERNLSPSGTISGK